MPSPSSNLSSTALTFTNASSEQCTTTFSSDGALEVSKPFFAAQGVTASGLVVNDGSSFVAISTFADIGASEVQLNGSTSGTLTLLPAATTTNHTLTLPSAQGAASSLLQNNGSGTLTWAAASTADTVGPSSATDNAVARFDLTTGKLLQNSSVTISDAAGVAGVKTIALSGATSGTLTVQPGGTTTNHTLTMPSTQGAASSYLKNNGAGALTWASAGDATGPSSATDNAVARFDATTGKLLQNSGVTISDTADVAGAKTVALSGSTSGVLTLQPGATTTNHTLTLPSAQGAASSLLQNNGSGTLTWAAASTADTVGPSSATDNAVARFDATTGKLLQNSGVTISDTADVAGAKTVALSGSTSGVLTLQPGATTTDYTLTLPSAQGAASSYLKNDGAGALTWASAGDAYGPSSATDNAVARFDLTTGKLLQNSGVTISDTADVAGAKTIAMSGSVSGVLTVQPGATTANHTLTLPSAQGAASTYLQNDGSGSLSWQTAGDASGPASATDNAVARFDATSGKLLQNSGVTISDTADVEGVKTLAVSGATSGALTIQPSATTATYSLTLPAAQGAASSFLGNDGTGLLSWLAIAGAGPVIKGLQVITASGTYTPTAGTTRALVYATGAGGSGGGVTATPNNAASSGGDGAGTYVGLFAIDDTNTGTVTIGVGGTGGTGAGANGTSTTFLFPATGTPSGTITGNFGRGGTADTSSADEQFTPNIAADAGGSATAINAVFLGGYSIEGTHGTYGLTIAPDYGISGAGGRSFFADGGRAYAINNTNSRINGTVGGTGAGGGGAIQTNGSQTGTGGNGGSGQVLVIEL